ncbi:unnamed protein product [Trichogramma brassicae]|uniref:Uncharacterized protein n=1 Tax=Trichogramma brassicae TaxID=86971 RepID=A0A6H5J646_9HYME|nr:unnamed protein product [Trichogramma brassicae]
MEDYLMKAVFDKNHQETLELLKEDVDLNHIVKFIGKHRTNKDLVSILHLAVCVFKEKEEVHIIEKMLKKKANPNLLNIFHIGPMHVAFQKQDESLINLLLKYGAVVDPFIIDLCIKHEVSEQIRMYYYYFVDLATQPESHSSGFFDLHPLHMALLSKDLYGVDLLISRGVSINIATRTRRWTLLHIVANRYEGTTALITRIDEEDKTEAKRFEVLRCLLAKGCDVTIPALDGKTALHYAWERRDFDCCKMLLEPYVAAMQRGVYVDRNLLDQITASHELHTFVGGLMHTIRYANR